MSMKRMIETTLASLEQQMKHHQDSYDVLLAQATGLRRLLSEENERIIEAEEDTDVPPRDPTLESAAVAAYRAAIVASGSFGEYDKEVQDTKYCTSSDVNYSIGEWKRMAVRPSKVPCPMCDGVNGWHHVTCLTRADERGE